MAKNAPPLAPDFKQDRRRSRFLPIASILVMAPLLAPLVMEAASICYAQWCEMLGKHADVRTPRLDAIGDGIETIRADAWNRLSSSFQAAPWNPKVVMPIIVVVMAIAMLMIRH